MEKVEREVDRRLLNFLSGELEKQGEHMPMYNNSESTAALLLELKLSTYEQVADKLSSFSHLLFISPYSDLATFVA